MAQRKNFPTRVEVRQIDANTRQEARNLRTDVEQLQKLTDAGHSHCKEAKRLQVRIENSAPNGA